MSKSLKIFALLAVVLVLGLQMSKNEAATGVEICDNGIDDDNDGLTDINDPDCSCHLNGDTLLFTSSLIPNSSFEEKNCCPTNIAQLSCAKNWIQASNATTDYFNTCGYMGDVFRSVPPMPLPAGNGFVAFRDEDNYKEYTGACLNSPLLDGVEYRLQFYVGFGKPGQVWASASPFHLSIFGAKYCSDLPFGIAGVNYTDCPMGLPNWIEIADTYVTGKDEWVKVTVDFVMNQDIEVIAIGPSCDKVLKESYYFLDGLQLAEKKAFEVKQVDVKADVCRERVVLTAPSFPGVQYQWYKDGVALLGATSRTYTINAAPEANYQVRLMINGDCLVTDPYHYKYLKNQFSFDTVVCENAVISWEGQTISKSGTYTAKYSNQFGCDSILTLNVIQNPTSYQAIDTMICQGESLAYHGQTFTTPGVHQIHLTTHLGCDSLIEINLGFHPVFNQRIDTSVCAGEAVQIGSETIDKSGSYSFNLPSKHQCDSIIELHLTVLPEIVRQIDTIVCESEQVFVGGQWFSDKGSYEIGLTSETGCDSTIQLTVAHYPEYSIQKDTSICYGDLITIDNRTISKTGDYTFNYQSIHGCDSVRVIHVDVMPELSANVKMDAPISCNGANDGRLAVLSQGGNGTYAYRWNNGMSESQIKDLSPGDYEVTVTDGMGCQTIEHFTLEEPEVLHSELESAHPTCLDPEGGKILVRSMTGGTSPYQVKINGRLMDPVTMKDENYPAGTYDVQVLDAHGCTWEASVEFTEPGLGTIDLQTDKKEVRRGQNISLQLEMEDLAMPLKSIKWRPDALFNCKNCESVDFLMDRSNLNVEVEVVDDDDCIYTRSIPFKADGKFFTPNVFTPNGDGLNDVFKVFSDDQSATILQLRIFDRKGQLVFYVHDVNIEDPSSSWNGEFRGNPMNPATFVYTLEIVDQLGIHTILSGDVTLVR